MPPGLKARDDIAREGLPESAADLFRAIQERAGLMLSRARPMNGETGGGGNAEEDERNSRHRTVDEGEGLAFSPDLGKRLPFQARVDFVRNPHRTEKRGDEVRRGIGPEVPGTDQDPTHLVDHGAAR